MLPAVHTANWPPRAWRDAIIIIILLLFCRRSGWKKSLIKFENDGRRWRPRHIILAACGASIYLIHHYDKYIIIMIHTKIKDTCLMIIMFVSDNNGGEIKKKNEKKIIKKNGRNRLNMSGNNNYAIDNNSHFSEQLLYGRRVVFGVSTQESAMY